MGQGISFDLTEILARLSAYFPAEQVKSFPMTVTKDKTKAMAAFYIDARAVQQRLDDTCVWRNEPFQEGPKGGVMAGISILIQRPDGAYEWVTRWDGADNTDIEAIKGGFSDSMRRTAVQWGIGRYLYKVPGQWLPLKEGGKYFENPPRIPAEFLPEGTRRAKASAAPAVPAEPTAAPAAKKAAKPAEKKETAAEKKAEQESPRVTLSADQVNALKAASDGKDRNAVKVIYGRILSGEIGLADGITEIAAL